MGNFVSPYHEFPHRPHPPKKLFIYIYIYRERELGSSYTWCNYTVGLHYIHILSMLAKFHGDQRLIIILLINYLNSNFCSLKLFIKNESMDYIVNNIWLAWKFTCILSIYKTCNSMVGFLKYEFNNKLLGGVTSYWT